MTRHRAAMAARNVQVSFKFKLEFFVCLIFVLTSLFKFFYSLISI